MLGCERLMMMSRQNHVSLGACILLYSLAVVSAAEPVDIGSRCALFVDDCPEIYADQVDGMVRWQGSSDVSGPVGTPVRLRFVLKDVSCCRTRTSIRFNSE